MLTGDGMSGLDNKVSVTFVIGVTGPDEETVFTEDAGVDCVGGAGVAAVMAWGDTGGVFTVVETIGFCSTGAEEDSEVTGIEVTGIAGGHAAAGLGVRDVQAWLWSVAGTGISDFAVMEEFSSDCRM